MSYTAYFFPLWIVIYMYIYQIKPQTCNVLLSRLDSVQTEHVCNIRIMINVSYLVSDQVLKKSYFFSFNTFHFSCHVVHLIPRSENTGWLSVIAAFRSPALYSPHSMNYRVFCFIPGLYSLCMDKSRGLFCPNLLWTWGMSLRVLFHSVFTKKFLAIKS